MRCDIGWFVAGFLCATERLDLLGKDEIIQDDASSLFQKRQHEFLRF